MSGREAETGSGQKKQWAAEEDQREHRGHEEDAGPWATGHSHIHKYACLITLVLLPPPPPPRPLLFSSSSPGEGAGAATETQRPKLPARSDLRRGLGQPSRGRGLRDAPPPTRQGQRPARAPDPASGGWAGGPRRGGQAGPAGHGATVPQDQGTAHVSLDVITNECRTLSDRDISYYCCC